jgi:uncharacterized membrane protein YphA (DoxX/SURF4 family)
MGALEQPPFIGVIRHLGYPDYFMTIVGIWYILAGVALLAPRFPRLKEWAYAGLIFNYTGAAISHLVQCLLIVFNIIGSAVMIEGWQVDRKQIWSSPKCSGRN